MHTCLLIRPITEILPRRWSDMHVYICEGSTKKKLSEKFTFVIYQLKTTSKILKLLRYLFKEI